VAKRLVLLNVLSVGKLYTREKGVFLEIIPAEFLILTLTEVLSGFTDKK